MAANFRNKIKLKLRGRLFDPEGLAMGWLALVGTDYLFSSQALPEKKYFQVKRGQNINF